MEPDMSDLLNAWLGREIDPARYEQLLGRLRADEVFRREFVAEVRMYGMLKTVQSPEPRWLRLEDDLGWSAAEAFPTDGLEDRVAGRLDDLTRVHRTWRRKWLVAAAAVLIAAVSLATLWPNRRGPIPVATTRPYPRVETTAGLAMVLKLDGVTWEPAGEPHPAEGDVLAAGRFRFGSGRATLSMLTGVVLGVEGPADFELVAFDRVLCHRGRMRARVPAGAEGFLVLGPSSAVIDLGTEFGLNVATDGKMRGQVFEGTLEAALLSAEGTPQRSLFLDAAQASASKAFEVDSRSGHIEVIATSEDFIRASERVAPPLTLGVDYPAAVRSARPWGYWRFSAINGAAIANEIPGRPALRSTGPIRLGAGPDGNRWAEFRAEQGRQFLELRELWNPTWHPGFAVEFWFMPVAIGYSSMVSIVAPRNTNRHAFLMELTSLVRKSIHKPASVRLLHRWPAAGGGGDDTYSHEPYVPYRWHHVVGQVKNDRIELYLDGRLSSELTITPEHSDRPCQLLLGRLTSLPGTGPSIDRPFVGRMDEVALYDHPLTLEEIANHRRLGVMPPRPSHD
jgi:hypothetical protein